MMKMTEDDTAWAEAWLDTPLGSPIDARNTTDAMTKPGCAVKSKEREGVTTWPKYFGVVVSFDTAQDRVRIRSHRDNTPRRVWDGTSRQFFAMWECD